MTAYIPTKRTRAERLEAWVATASKGHDGIYNEGGPPGHRKRIEVVPPDTRTPIERLHAMIEAGKKIGVDLDEDFIADVKARLSAA